MAKKKRKGKVFGGGEHRPRLRLSGRTFKLGGRSPYKGRSWSLNPYLREVSMFSNNPRGRRRSRRNPGVVGGATGAISQVVRNPMRSVTDGLTGVVAAYLTISIPNMLLPFPGVDIMSKLLRLGTRVAAGGALYSLWRTPAVMTGASIAAIGGGVLDFFNTRIIIGQGDVGQQPLALLAPVIPGTVGAYTRPMLAAARGLRAYTGPQLPSARGLAGRGGVIKHGLYG